jgi:hypothetical protein
MTKQRRAWIPGVFATAALSFGWAGCHAAQPTGGEWITGGTEDRFATVGRHLRGLDVAMVEVGHRYAELQFAGLDRNWDAAAYQATKIRLALELAVERRPKRGPSMQPFLVGSLSALEQAIAARDGSRFDESFEALTAGCNACHAAEQVPFFRVVPPPVRTSVLRGGLTTP